jgi:hypothetical protein
MLYLILHSDNAPHSLPLCCVPLWSNCEWTLIHIQHAMHYQWTMYSSETPTKSSRTRTDIPQDNNGSQLVDQFGLTFAWKCLACHLKKYSLFIKDLSSDFVIFVEFNTGTQLLISFYSTGTQWFRLYSRIGKDRYPAFILSAGIGKGSVGIWVGVLIFSNYPPGMRGLIPCTRNCA